MDWKKESEMFNQMSDYYDRFRPGYPDEIIHTLIKETGIQKGAKLLEIGAGSGKATELLADGGYTILAIDPGNDLVEKGNRRFSETSIRFKAARFEECELPERYYDVVYSAQAFHWIPQPAGYEKCALTLKDNGFLALFWNMYIVFDNDSDWELLSISKRHGGFADFLSESECENRICSITAGIKNSGLFSTPKIFRKLWTHKYSADDYYGFALTSNTFVQQSEREKKEARVELTALAEKNNGLIERPYLCVLYIATKL